MNGVAYFRANLLDAYRGIKRPRDDACPSKKIVLEETLEDAIANPQIMFERLYERIREAMTEDILRLIVEKADVNATSVDIFHKKLASLWKRAQIGSLNSVETFKQLGICSFTYHSDPNIFGDLDQVQIAQNDGRRFSRFPNNSETWLRLKVNIRDKITKFVLRYFGMFGRNKGEKIVCVSNLIITPFDRKQKLVIQKLHLDHMYGPGNEVVVAIDFSGAPLRSRYFTGSHDLEHFSRGFNKRLNGGQGSLGSHREPGVSCNATRVADLLVHAIDAGRDIRYAEAPENGMIFDAGGLHSGNAVISNGPRVFWTFRTVQFHNRYTKDIREKGLQEFMTQDTWFPQANRFVLGMVQ